MFLGADAVVHVEHRVRRGIQIAGFHHATRPAALHQHHRMILDRQARSAVRHHRPGDGQIGTRQQHTAQIDEMDPQIQQRPAARGRAVDHPFDVLLIVTVHHAADKFERQILQRLARRDLADGVDDRAVTKYHRHRGEHLRRGGALGDVPGLGCVQRAGLFHREGNAAVDQEARDLGHVAMPAQRKRKVGMQARAHLPVVGEGGTMRAPGQRFGARHVRIADTDDGHVRHLQHRV